MQKGFANCSWALVRCVTCGAPEVAIERVEISPGVDVAGQTVSLTLTCGAGDLFSVKYETRDGRVVREVIPVHSARKRRELEDETWRDVYRLNRVSPDIEGGGAP